MSEPTTPRTRKAPAAARKPSGKVRTGNPVEDRAVRAAAAKAPAVKATPAKRAAAKAPALTQDGRTAAALKRAAAKLAQTEADLIQDLAARRQREAAADKAKAAAKAPAKRAAAKAAPAKAVALVTFTPTIKAKHLTAAPVSLPKGYFIKWDNGAYLLAKPGEGAAAGGPAWFVICTEHGTTTQATSARDGDHLGRKADRGTWCKKCQG